MIHYSGGEYIMLSDARKDFYLCLFLGVFGVHKFRKGKTEIGFFYLLTLGVFGIGWIIDTIIYLVKLIHLKNSIIYYCYKEITEVDEFESGYDFEEYVAGLLEELGFEEVEITNPSRDFGADILAYKGDKKYAFQCKLYSDTVGLYAVQEVYAAKAYYNCDIAIAVTNSKFSSSAQELAEATQVLLWDREKLTDLLYYLNSPA